MPNIRILEPDLIGRIAAGEVVERPASAAKELIENALDAGATSISVTLKEGGLKLLRVSDNGCGMTASDAQLAFTRHATSKLPEGDLVNLSWLGFRGEALPSIAAVARVTLRTRVKGANEGILLAVDQGVRSLPEPAGCPEGTIIEVEDLFARVPARLKFMKRPAYEAAAVADLMADMALLRPDVAFRLESDGKPLLRAPGGELRDAALSVYGPTIASALIAVDGQDAYVRVSGLVGVGDVSHANRSRQTLMVNGRVVRSAALSGGIELATRERVLTGRFPLAVLRVEIPADQVDVNVHPNKLEVRFRDEGRVRLAVAEVVRQAMAGDQHARIAQAVPQHIAKLSYPNEPAAHSGLHGDASAPITPTDVPSGPPNREKPPEAPVDSGLVDRETRAYAAAAPSASEMRGSVRIIHPRVRQEPIVLRESSMLSPAVSPLPSAGLRRLASDEAGPGAHAQGEVVALADPVQPVIGEQLVMEQAAEPVLRVIGAWRDAYILLDAGDTLLILDQHAGHERLLFDALSDSFAHDGASQPLLVPMTVPLSAREKEGLLEQSEALRAIGLEVEDFGPREVRVRAVPHILGAPQTASFVQLVASRLSEIRGLDTRELQRDALARMACRAAVKAGDKLSLEQMKRLIGDLRGAPPTCPHGRPIYLRIAQRELEKRFGRLL